MLFFRISFIALLLTLSGNNYASNQSLVETRWLIQNLNKVVVLDVRVSEKSFTSTPTYRTNKKTGNQFLSKVGGHIPGARLILYKNVRSERSIDDKSIKFMAVSSDKFETFMRQTGVNQDSHIVITSNAESTFDLTMATRMFWQVKHYGHNNVSLLNGGTAQWIIDGHKVDTTKIDYEAGNWQARQRHDSILADSLEVEAATKNSDVQIVDIRPLGQYLGTFKSAKAKSKGHIPTAKVLPVDLLSSRSMPVKFLSASEITQLAAALGVDKHQSLITYCNSGHMASGGWFVFHELLGNNNTKLYDGSMHQWTHEGRPIVSMKME